MTGGAITEVVNPGLDGLNDDAGCLLGTPNTSGTPSHPAPAE